jgi:hypothetical protein
VTHHQHPTTGLGAQFPLASGPKIALVAILAAAGVAFDLMGLLAFRAARTTINPLVVPA